jgi:transposase
VAGEISVYRCALALIDSMKTDTLLADKGYDANYIVEAAQNIEAIAVIPLKSNRIIHREYDKELYKERNFVERLFNKLKKFRMAATRYDRTTAAFMG